MTPQLPTSAAATSRASKPAPPAITRDHGSRSRMTANRSGGGTLPARFLAKAETDCVGCRREPSVQPKDDGSSRPDRKKDDGFSADCCPKNLRITDCGKPQPVNQEVAREPEQDQANPDEDGRNDGPDHGASPWHLPFGSGNPDRHGLMIAEMRDFCRLIHAGIARQSGRRPRFSQLL